MVLGSFNLQKQNIVFVVCPEIFISQEEVYRPWNFLILKACTDIVRALNNIDIETRTQHDKLVIRRLSVYPSDHLFRS